MSISYPAMPQHPFRSLFIMMLLAFGLVNVSTASHKPLTDSQLKSGTIGITLLEPADQTLITDPAVEFSWQPLTDAVKYRLLVRGTSGFKYKAKLNTSVCVEDLCTFNPAGDPKWQPKFGEALTWSISSKIDGEKVTSPTRTLQTDFLPAVLLHTPTQGNVITTTQVAFSWQHDARVDRFKLAIKPGNSGKTFKVAVLPEQACDATTCTVNVDLASFTGKAFNGGYTWQVIAMREGVKGKSKSEKRQFTTSFFPTLELESPADGAKVATSKPEFMWADPLVVEQYRVIAVNQAGKKFKTAWQKASKWCDDDDCYTDSLTLPNDVYNWRIEGRNAGIDGKVKSSTRKLTVYNPEATPEVVP